jgi:hypothetical protein
MLLPPRRLAHHLCRRMDAVVAVAAGAAAVVRCQSAAVYVRSPIERVLHVYIEWLCNA